MKGPPRILGAAAWLLLLFAVPSAPVQAISTCRLTSTPLDFGVYQPGTPAALDAAGQLTVDCRGTPGLYFVILNAGVSGNATNRYMTLLANLLRYNVYLNAARTTIWGDGAGPTQVMIGLKLLPGRDIQERPFYGRVFAGQEPASGLYTDTLVATVLF